MNLIEEKKRIINQINEIKDPFVLKKIALYIENSASILNDNQKNEVRERRLSYLKNTDEVISLDEFKEQIYSKYGF